MTPIDLSQKPRDLPSISVWLRMDDYLWTQLVSEVVTPSTSTNQ